MAVAIGDTYMANIPGDQITFAPVDQAETMCFGGVQGNQGSNLQIYGDTMFKAQFGESSFLYRSTVHSNY